MAVCPEYVLTGDMCSSCCSCMHEYSSPASMSWQQLVALLVALLRGGGFVEWVATLGWQAHVHSILKS